MATTSKAISPTISPTISPGGRPEPANTWNISPEARERMIGEAAYYHYVHRGFAHGHALDDWLAAEADFERANMSRQPPEPDMDLEYGVQQGGPRGFAEDDVLKRMIKRHPRREIPAIESIEPEEAPLKE